ncbi:MAG: carboxypeptidase-like regulatory domain-containing protein, partial [Deferrisomatales bacterium]
MKSNRSSLAAFAAVACLLALSGLQAPGQAQAASYHSADYVAPQDWKFSLSELLRVIQLYNLNEYSCDAGTPWQDEGYRPGAGDRTCAPHKGDYLVGSGPAKGADWKIGLSELLRVIQLYNLGGYHGDSAGEDGYEPGLPAPVVVARTVSGTVRDLSADGAALLPRSDLPVIGGARVEVWADLNGDGLYGAGEAFAATGDDRGFFSVPIPGEADVARLKVRVSKAGYSEFVREYEEFSGALVLAPVLAAGDVVRIDLAGVAAGPARGGRIALLGDEVVTVRLVKDRATGRRAARVTLGRGADPGAETEPALFTASFPVRGLRLAADAPPQVYASVGYLDTVNAPDLMPGGFRGEGEGDTPVDLLTTYAASQIKLYDASGQELMTDPTDRTKTVHIKMVLPVEAFASLVDEDPATDVVEIPLFYFDEAAAIWKLHKKADGTTAYGWLQDNYGNRLTRSDLSQLQATRAEGAATVPDPQYAPAGVSPADVTVYGVGEVHHFTTWNCDRSGSSTSFHAEFKDKNGKPVKADFRLRGKKGGTTTDSDRPGPDGRVNLHTNYDRNADSLIKKLLDRQSESAARAEILWIIQHGKNPYAKQALIEALRRYAENLRDDIAQDNSGGDLGRGFRAIFNNKTIQDAFIGTDGLDCTKTPDLCNGILGAAAETVNQSKAGQKAVAVLMEIAVDAYNPGSIDFDYLVNKGVDLLDATVEMEGIKDAKGDMEQIYSGVKQVKALADQVKELKKTSLTSDAAWGEYWKAMNEFKAALGEVKNVAMIIGGRGGRAASRRLNLSVIPPPEPPTGTLAEREAATVWIEHEALLEGEDVGGVFFGASALSRYIWGHFGATGFVPVAGAPAMPRAGGSLAVLEIFDGADWVPVPGASDRGVRADFIPIPATTSFGGGSPARPVAHLGTWSFDVDPNVQVTGKLLIQGTDRPARNAVVVIEGQEFRPDATGEVAGAMTAFVQSVAVSVPGAYWGSKAVAGGRVDLGTIQVPETIFWDPARSGYEVLRGAPLVVDPGARSVSGDPVLYTFRLYRSYWGKRSGEAPLDEAAGAVSYPFPTDPVGYYWLSVVGTVNGVSSEVGFNVNVRNNPPVIQSVTVTPASPKVGDELRVRVAVTDPDGDDEIAWRGLNAGCVDGAGARYWLWFVQEDGDWVARTDRQYDLYRAPGAALDCTVEAWASDRLGGFVGAQQSFTLTQSQVAPEVTRRYLAAEYTLACWRYDPEGPCELSTRPGYSVSFVDRNGDLDRYELDCGAGGEPVTSAAPITEACRY